MYHSLKNDPTKGDQSTANTFDLYLTKGPGVKFDLQLYTKIVDFFCKSPPLEISESIIY